MCWRPSQNMAPNHFLTAKLMSFLDQICACDLFDNHVIMLIHYTYSMYDESLWLVIATMTGHITYLTGGKQLNAVERETVCKLWYEYAFESFNQWNSNQFKWNNEIIWSLQSFHEVSVGCFIFTFTFEVSYRELFLLHECNNLKSFTNRSHWRNFFLFLSTTCKRRI